MIFSSSWSVVTASLRVLHCVKSVRIRSYSGSYFPAFGLNTEKYGVSLRIQSECEKIRTRITPNTDTFHVVLLSYLEHFFSAANMTYTINSKREIHEAPIIRLINPPTSPSNSSREYNSFSSIFVKIFGF